MGFKSELFGKLFEELKENGSGMEEKASKIDFEKLKNLFDAMKAYEDEDEDESAALDWMSERFVLLVRLDELDRLADETDDPALLAYIKRRKKELRAELDAAETK